MKIKHLTLLLLFTFNFSLFTKVKAQAPVYPGDSCNITLAMIDQPNKNNIEKYLNILVCQRYSALGLPGGPDTCSTHLDDIDWPNKNNTEKYLNMLVCLGQSGGGAGTVTSFSSGNLSPLFTTSVATATTTPALSFSLTNAAGGTLFGNTSGSTGAPAYTPTPVIGRVGTTGTLGLRGLTSGTVTIQPQSAAGTYNFNLPITAGTTGQVLTSQGGGATAMIWSTPNDTIYTATNALHKNPGGNFKLGGVMIENTTIDKTTDHRFIIQDYGTNANPGLEITGGTEGIIADGTQWAVAGQSSNIPLWGVNPSTSTNTVVNGLTLNKTTVSGASGMGINIQTNLKANILQFNASKLVTKWTDATDGNATAEFSIELTDTGAGTAATRLALGGSGQLTLNRYGVANFTGTPTYTLSVNASGNVIETPAQVSTIVTLTAADIQTLNSVPIDLSATYPATAGAYWRIIECDIEYIDGTVTFTNTIQASTNGAAQAQYSYDLSLLFGGGDALFSLTDRRAVGVSVYRANKALQIDASGDSATGDGSATIYITAELVTL